MCPNSSSSEIHVKNRTSEKWKRKRGKRVECQKRPGYIEYLKSCSWCIGCK